MTEISWDMRELYKTSDQKTDFVSSNMFLKTANDAIWKRCFFVYQKVINLLFVYKIPEHIATNRVILRCDLSKCLVDEVIDEIYVSERERPETVLFRMKRDSDEAEENYKFLKAIFDRI